MPSCDPPALCSSLCPTIRMHGPGSVSPCGGPRAVITYRRARARPPNTLGSCRARTLGVVGRALGSSFRVPPPRPDFNPLSCGQAEHRRLRSVCLAPGWHCACTALHT